jgi:hypothetical protein
MQTITEALSSVRLGEPARFQNLSVFPLFAPSGTVPDYLTLDEALDQGLARVTEISEGGSVPELAFENDAGCRVLLVDGEELVGSLQNRVLNLSILVAAKSKVVIPVSCVEQGRWRYVSPTFTSAKRNLYAKARAQKMAQVTESLRSAGTRQSDQSRIWKSIADKSERMASYSDTAAMADIYEQQQSKLREYVSAFAPQDFQVGAVFAINGKVVGADLFDAPATFRKFMARLIESYAMDAIEGDTTPDVEIATQQVKQFIADMEAAVAERFPPVGEGEDLRLSGKDLAGGALVADGRVVHLAAFRVEPQLTGGMAPASSRIRSRRRRNSE